MPKRVKLELTQLEAEMLAWATNQEVETLADAEPGEHPWSGAQKAAFWRAMSKLYDARERAAWDSEGHVP